VYHVQFGHSEAEFDPHAFLYWPDTHLLVVPLQVPTAVKTPGGPDSRWPTTGALAMQVEDEGFTELGMVSHPLSGERNPTIRRSLIVDRTLWTVSDAGLKGNDLDSLAADVWIPFR
jgi:Beta propeller domain